MPRLTSSFCVPVRADARLAPRLALLLVLFLSPALVAGAIGCSADRSPLGDAATSSDGAPSDDAGGAAGGGGGVTGSGGAGCAAAGAPSDPTLLIDDFEDLTSAQPPIAGRAGIWWASGDSTPDAIMDPFGDAPPELIPGGRCGSHRALHVTGSGFLAWGSQVTLALHQVPNAAGVYEEQPYDARARGYEGITFFARIGGTSVANVRFSVSDQYARPEAGLCVPNGTQGNACYDTFGVPLTSVLTTEWKELRIPWTGLAQQNFGLQGGIAPDVSQLYEIGFAFPGKVVFDLWVDDIRFY